MNVWDNKNDVPNFCFGKCKLVIFGDSFPYSLWLYDRDKSCFGVRKICDLNSSTIDEAIKEATDIYFRDKSS